MNWILTRLAGWVGYMAMFVAMSAAGILAHGVINTTQIKFSAFKSFLCFIGPKPVEITNHDVFLDPSMGKLILQHTNIVLTSHNLEEKLQVHPLGLSSFGIGWINVNYDRLWSQDKWADSLQRKRVGCMYPPMSEKWLSAWSRNAHQFGACILEKWSSEWNSMG